MAVLIKSAQIKNYKSIAGCRVRLGELTFLVGPNGSGKSNFLDALRFVADSLSTTVENALRDRGGIQSVRRRSRGHPTHFGIRLDFMLPNGREGFYAFKIGAEPEGAFVVQREECRIFAELGASEDFFVVEEGSVTGSSSAVQSAPERDRLALVAISGLSEFRPVYEGLRRMAFYNLNPQRIRDLQDPDPGQVLARDGRNLAAVIRELGRTGNGSMLHDVSEHLKAVVPGIVSVEHRTIGPKETIEFRQQVAGDENPWRFLAENMSDGTLRALGILVAALQGNRNGQRRVSLIGLEEPEMALHPGATEVIATVLLIASQNVQIVATTHSPELLDHKEIREDHLLAVSADRGQTVIATVAPAAKSALRDRLYSAGELLSHGAMLPDIEAATQSSSQMDLFRASPD